MEIARLGWLGGETNTALRIFGIRVNGMTFYPGHLTNAYRRSRIMNLDCFGSFKTNN